MDKAQDNTGVGKLFLTCMHSEGYVMGLFLYKEYKYLSNGSFETRIIIVQPVLDLLQNCLARKKDSKKSI